MCKNLLQSDDQNGIIAKRSFHRIWISNKNRYWNRPQAQAVCNVKLSTFTIRSRPKLTYGAGRNFGVGPQFGDHYKIVYMTRPLCCRGLLACAKICCSLMTNNGIIAKRSFHRIWISNKNRYWNGPQAQAVCNVKLSTFIIRLRPKLTYGAGRNFGVGPQFGDTRKQPIIPRNSRARSCAGEEDRVTWLDLWPG